MRSNNLNFAYLNHIDSLRAISVVFVILFHLNSEFFYYGYLGVDIFFVISGYVISNSIYTNQLLNNKSILEFYKKRFKRIYPILFLVIISFLIFYIIFSPLSGNTDFFLWSSISALFGLSNFYFINNEINYFLNESINPLLHTWSLGVEEQFYLVYPILIISIFKYFNGSSEKIFSVIFLLIILSFLIYYFDKGLFGNFYFPLARFWEIGLGCLAFFYPKIRNKFKLPISFIFIIFIGISIINFSNEKFIQHTNLIATIVTFFLITYLRNFDQRYLDLILKKTFLPYLGKISYSLYLWHLPVLYFCEIYFSGIYLSFLFITISLSLSVISYHLYENPLRNTKILELFFYKLLKFSPILILSIFITFFTLSKIQTINPYLFLKKINYPEKKLNKFLNRLDYKHINYLESECQNRELFLECNKISNQNHVIYLTGDSHADHLLPTVDSMNLNHTFFYNKIAECEIILKSFYLEKQFDQSSQCDDINYKKLNEELNVYKNKTLVISLRLSEYLKPGWKIYKNQNFNKKTLIIKNYKNFINFFPNSKIILVTTVPESSVHTEKCIFNEYLRKEENKNIFNECHFKRSEDIKRYNLIKSLLNDISRNHENIYIYDPYFLLCPDKICHNYNPKTDFFMLHDKDHLSIEASKFLSKDFERFINNI